MAVEAQLGIIGGSRMYEMGEISNVREVELDTPFGNPSDKYVLGDLGGLSVAFLPRHGKGHRIPAHQIPHEANIYGFRKLGVERLVSVSAVGSLRDDLSPLDMVIPDQLDDQTGRGSTFFNDVAVHVTFAEPFCRDMRDWLYWGAAQAGVEATQGGTYICMRGPQFGTRFESIKKQNSGGDVVGMTLAPEVKLGREACLCVANLAMVTDNDSYRKHDPSVTGEMVAGYADRNAATAKRIIPGLASFVAHQSLRTCACPDALEAAVLTDPQLFTDSISERLAVLKGSN